MSPWALVLTPLVGAFIGWVTNLIAVKMLFRPIEPWRVLGLSWQGLVPRRRREIAATVARTVERDLLSADEISDVLHRLDWQAEVTRAVDEIVERRVRALRPLPFADLVIGAVKEVLTKQLLKEIEERRNLLVERFRERLDLQAMVVRRLDRYDIAEFEALVLKVADRELSAIVWLGAVLGFLVGLAQVGLLALIG